MVTQPGNTAKARVSHFVSEGARANPYDSELRHGLCVCAELRRERGLLWEGGARRVLLLDEDQGWLLVGGRDHVHLLKSDSLEQPISKVSRPISRRMTCQEVEEPHLV